VSLWQRNGSFKPATGRGGALQMFGPKGVLTTVRLSERPLADYYAEVVRLHKKVLPVLSSTSRENEIGMSVGSNYCSDLMRCCAPGQTTPTVGALTEPRASARGRGMALDLAVIGTKDKEAGVAI
jgi:hypothetical protein